MRSNKWAAAAVLAFVVFAGFHGVAAQTKTVNEELRELAEKSSKQYPVEVIEAGIEGEKELEESGILDSALNVGDVMPSFSLYDANDTLVSSDDVLKEGNLILVFYRGAWCPYCNLYLRGLERRLDEFREAGGVLVAVSIEPPDRSLALSEKNRLSYTVLSDPELTTARKFGIVFEVPKRQDEAIKNLGLDIAEYNGADKAELPLAATYVISKQRKIEFAFLDPDYKKRASPDDILEVLRKIASSPEK